jgi:hypothetical protein
MLHDLGSNSSLFFQNFMMWLDLFDNIVTNWKKLIAVPFLSRATTRG